MLQPLDAAGYGDGHEDDDIPRSRYTYRDLRHLGQSSVTSPLRVIALVDFDCFYAQCEKVRLGLPNDQPLGVQQFKHVIAMNYPARAAGLKKVVTAVEAKQKCPSIVLQHVPTWREGDTTWAYRDDVLDHMDSDKSSLDYYRLQSRRWMEVVKSTLPTKPPQKIEKAGIDEVFLDLSAQVHVNLVERYPELVTRDNRSLDSPLPNPPTEILDWQSDYVYGTDEQDEDQRVPDWNDVALSVGAEIVRNLRAEIHTQLHYTCSAGISHNKVIAKLAAGHNKPNKQTVVRDSCTASFLSSYKFTKIRGLGGKLGNKAVQRFGTDTVSDLLEISLKRMQSELGPESGSWVYRVIRGIEHSEVVSRTQIKSMMSTKTFTPSITGLEQAEKWLHIFAADIMGRVEDQEGRRPRTIAVHHQPNGRFGPTRSKQAPIAPGAKLDTQYLLALARNILIDITREEGSWPCLCLAIGVSDFGDTDTTSQSLTSFWAPRRDVTACESGNPATSDPYQVLTKTNERKKRTMLDYQIDVRDLNKERVDSRDESVDELRLKRRRSSSSPVVDRVPTDPIADGEYPCPTCAKVIPASSVLEHLDWHVALDLQHAG